MDAENKFQAEYSDYLTSFKTLSFDDANNESLCQDTTHRYYNFDKIVKSRNKKSTPASPDTIIFKDDKIYCVEFKNSFKEGISPRKLKNKLKDGHQVLKEIFTELNLQLKEYQLIFCVVHKGFGKNKTKESAQTKMHRKFQKSVIQFDLKKFKGVYFDDIVTNDIDFFRQQFIAKINPNLPC